MRYGYDEFISKKGTVIRLMDLRDYFNSLPDNEKTDKFGSDELTCTCPYCSTDAYKVDTTYHNQPYWKQKLYITRDFKKGFCHRCGASYWTNEFNLNYEIPELTVDYGVPSLDDISFEITDPNWTLDKFKQLPEELTQPIIDQLYNRNPYTMNFYEELGFRPIDDIRFAIPFYWKGNLLYYQISQRGMTPKYYFPKSRNKPLYICGPLKRKAILVEGVFDAVAERILHPDYTPIALLGCTVTLAQDLMLRSLFLDSLLVRMDDSVKSYKVYNRVKTSLEFTDLEVIESDGTDPEEQLCNIIKWTQK